MPLRLTRETIRVLDADKLGKAAGGAADTAVKSSTAYSCDGTCTCIE